MKATPKVSIVVPAYNSERFLVSCLKSAETQTLQDIEVICVNDGSTDGSLAVMEEFSARDERFRVINKVNGGYGQTMNHGIEAATGTYVAILESDDLIKRTMLSDLYACAEKNGLDFVKADFETFYGEGASLRTSYKHIASDAGLYSRLVNPQNEFEAFDVDMVTWTGIYRRSFLEAHDIRYNESPGAAYQDNGFWFQTFALANRVMFVPKAYYLYRQDNPNSSINNRAKIFCMCDEHTFMHDFLDRHPELDPHLYRMWSKKMYHNYMFTYNRIAPEYREMFLQRFAKDFIRAFEQGELAKDDFFPEEWARLNDIMDNPLLSYRKYEDIIINAEDRLVERHWLRQKQQEVDALRSELRTYCDSRIFKGAAALKRVNDYRRDYGMAQLVRRSLFKIPACKAPRARDVYKQIDALNRIPPLPVPYLALADGYTGLDSEVAVSSWYRRKTGESLNLKKPRTLEERVQVYKLRNAQEFCEALGSFTRVYEYAKRRIDARFLDKRIRVLDSFDDLENYLFEYRSTAFTLRINAKVPWEAQVFDYERLDMEALGHQYRMLIQSNLSFIAGEHIIQNAEGHALLASVLPVTKELDYRFSICCAYGKPLLIVKTAPDDVHGRVPTYYAGDGQLFLRSQVSDKKATLSLQNDMIEAAMKLSAEFPFIVVVFEGNDVHPILRNMNFGLFNGLIGNHEKQILDYLSRELNV